MTEKQKNLLAAIVVLIIGAAIALSILYFKKPAPTANPVPTYVADNTNRDVHLTGSEAPEELHTLAENAYRDRLSQSTSTPGITTYTNPVYNFKISFPSDFNPVIAGWDTNQYIVLEKITEDGKWQIRVGVSAQANIDINDSSSKPNTTFKGYQAALVGGPYEGGYMDGAGSKLPTGVSYYLTVYKGDPSLREGYRIVYSVDMAKDISNGSGIMSDEQVKAYGDAVAVFNTYKPEMDQIISTFEIIK